MTIPATAGEAFDLTSKVVWVTGSSRGIGAGIARHLARHGATVVVHGGRAESVEPILAELAAAGATAVVGDVRDPAAVAEAVATIEGRHGRLDGVVANVGGAAPGLLADSDAARFARQLDLNLVSAYSTLRAAQPLLAAAGGAAVVVSATATSGATPMFGAYGAAKAALEHRAGRTTAVGRIGEPADIAWACHYLLSGAASFVSGATLVVDGGPTEGPTQRILRAIAEP